MSRWSNQLISQQINSGSRYLRLRFKASFCTLEFNWIWFWASQVWARSLELSTNQLRFYELDNIIYFPPSEASVTATRSSSTAFINQGTLHQSSLCTCSHQGNYSSFNIFSTVWWIIVTDIITSTTTSSVLTSLPSLMGDYVFASGCFRHCRLVISPSQLTYYANADERLHHYHRLLHCYWVDHRHRHLHQHPVKPLQDSLRYCYW